MRRLTFATSLLVHAVVFAWLWLAIDPAPPREPPLEIEIKIKDQKSAANTALQSPPTRRRPHSANGKAKTAAMPGWNKLKVAGDFGLAKTITNPPSWTEEDTSGWSPEQWGAGGAGGMAQISHTLQFDKLAVEIDGMLNYPGVLARHGFEGTVNARLAFGKDSQCAWPRTKIMGGPRYFQIYILALLKKLCSLETVAHMDFPDGQLVDLSFRFAIDTQMIRDPETLVQGRLRGNVLLFTRLTPRLPLQYNIGPLQGSFLFPMVSLDWPWVVEHWDTWVEGKDPLREFRSAN